MVRLKKLIYSVFRKQCPSTCLCEPLIMAVDENLFQFSNMCRNVAKYDGAYGISWLRVFRVL